MAKEKIKDIKTLGKEVEAIRKEAEAEIKKASLATITERQDVIERISKDDKAIEEATARKEEATKQGDDIEFIKAREDVLTATALKDMHNKRLKNLESTKNITPEHYDEIEEIIKEKVSLAEEITKKKLAKLSEVMQETGKELLIFVNSCNEFLNALENEAFEKPTRTPIDIAALVSWSNSGIADREFKKHKQEQEEI